MITSTAVGQQVAETITAQIAASGMTRKAVYTRANMSRDTFDRRLANGEFFTLNELLRISEALRIPAGVLLEPVAHHTAA